MGLYVPMLIAVVASLSLIGAVDIVDRSYGVLIDRQMQQYGANVILRAGAVDSVSGGVPVHVERISYRGEEVNLATTTTDRLLSMNPAWLVKGSGPVLVGEEVADRFDLSRGAQSPFPDVPGTIALLASGTRFDSHVFVDGRVENPSMLLLRSANPSAYRGTEQAVVLSEMVKSRYDVLTQVRRLLLIVALLSGLATVATIVNLTRLDAEERRKEFGIFRAMGATPSHLRALLGGEYAFLAVLSWLLGTAGAFGLSWLILQTAADTAPVLSVYPLLYVGGIGAGAFGLAAWIYLSISNRHRVINQLRRE